MGGFEQTVTLNKGVRVVLGIAGQSLGCRALGGNMRWRAQLGRMPAMHHTGTLNAA